MKILVTGSSGMLGSALSKTLKPDNTIVGMDLVEPEAQDAGLKAFYKADITELDSVKKIFDKETFDLVIHAAAWTDVDGCENEPDRAYAANTLGTRNIKESSKEVPVIFISTDFVFDGEKSSPYAESDSPNPINVYGRTKLEGEEIISKLAYYTIIRTSWLFGRGGKNFVDAIIEKRNEKSLSVVNDQVGSPTYAKDLASAIKELIEKNKTRGKEVFHVSNSGECSWYDFAREITLGIKAEVSIEGITSEKLARPAKRPLFSVLDNSKFKKETGYIMRPWKEALSEYLKEKRLVN